MPKQFDNCVKNGGKVRTVSGPNKDHGLKDGEYVRYCVLDGKSHRGEVKMKMKEAKDDPTEEQTLTEAQSMDEVRTALVKAICDMYGYSGHVRDWEKQWVYYSKAYDDPISYKQKYTYDAKTKMVTLEGGQIKVERAWKKIRESVNAQLIESRSKDGSIWRVALIKAGTSLNGYTYSAGLLRESAGLFEGAKSYLRTDDEHLLDSNKSIKNMAGVHKNVEFNEAAGCLESDYHIIDAGLREKLLEAERLGVLSEIGGLSIVASGKATKKLVEGKVTFEVSALTDVSSVDPVAVPSAGGKFIKLAAAFNKEGDTVVLEKMIEAVKRHKDLYSQIDVNNVDEAKVLSLYQEVVVREAKTADPPKKEEPKKKEEANMALIEAQAEKRFTDWQKEQEAKQARKDLLATKLRESKLPEKSHRLVEAQFDITRGFTPEDVDNAIDGVREILAESSPTGQIKGFGDTISISEDQRDKYSKAMDGFFAGQDVDGTPRFKSFRESYQRMTDNYRLSASELTDCMFQASKYIDASRNKKSSAMLKLTESLTTASWTQVLGDSITRRMVKEYLTPKYYDWRKIVSEINPISDFRTNRRMRVGGYGDLPVVNQSGAYNSLASPSDEESTYAISKRGGTEDLTLEMIANDDVGAIRLIPRNLGRAAARTLYKAIFALIVDNSATTYDSVALFHASHNNLGATALSATTLEAATIAMMGQTLYGGTTGDELGTMPKFLLVPLNLRDTAFRLTTSPTLIGATNNAGTEPNIHATKGLIPLEVPHWSDTNDWALVCDPMDCPTIEVGFYAGQEEPELFVQDNPNIGTPFSNDIITYKIRHIWGICVLDHRGMYKAVVA